jgi:hypothetical protein
VGRGVAHVGREIGGERGQRVEAHKQPGKTPQTPLNKRSRENENTREEKRGKEKRRANLQLLELHQHSVAGMNLVLDKGIKHKENNTPHGHLDAVKVPARHLCLAGESAIGRDGLQRGRAVAKHPAKREGEREKMMIEKKRLRRSQDQAKRDDTLTQELGR